MFASPTFLRIGGGKAIEVSHIRGYSAETQHVGGYTRDGQERAPVAVLCVTIHLDTRTPDERPIHYLEGDEAAAFLAWARAREINLTPIVAAPRTMAAA